MAYTTLTTDFNRVPWLGALPLSVEEGLRTYDLKKLVPENTTEVLIYAFATVTNSPESGGQVTRSAYEFFTEDSKGNHYSQLLNIAFTNNDVVCSANMWLPICEYRELKARLPLEWTGQGRVAQAHRPRREKDFSNLAEAMKAYTSGQERVAEVFLLGYRTSDAWATRVKK